MLELSVNMLGFVWFEGDTMAAVHRHPQDRRTISLAGTSCTSGVVSGRNAASMAQRAICASSKPSDDLSSSLFLRFDFEWSNFATAITDGGILKAIMMIPPLSILVPLYFDQDPDVVLDLVGRAARLGVERFVLDDGWFHARRTDTAGLGDWWVDRSVWPDGLKPLADAVHAHGMEFGLWFEPEMVNPDSDLFRAHPDWILQASGRMPLPHRNQQVLDLTNPDAFAHVFEQISTVLGECGVDYVKWDHNRDLLEAGTNTRGGAPAVHEQTVAYYRLLDTLRGRFPNIQWESCASGGGRIDLDVIEHVERVWTSDMTDALSRQRIQPWRVAACPRPGPEGALPAAVGGAGGRGPRGRIAGGVPPRLGSSAGVGPVGSGRHHHRRGLGHDRRAHPPLPSRDDPSNRDCAGLIRNNEGPVGGRSSNMTIPRPRGLRLRHPDQPVFWRPAATPDTVHRMR